jgi:hypothetical protein
MIQQTNHKMQIQLFKFSHSNKLPRKYDMDCVTFHFSIFRNAAINKWQGRFKKSFLWHYFFYYSDAFLCRLVIGIRRVAGQVGRVAQNVQGLADAVAAI